MSTYTFKVTGETEIEVPEEATHFRGSFVYGLTFYKCKKIGAVGEHWFFYDRNSVWHFCGHRTLRNLKELEDPIEENIDLQSLKEDLESKRW